MTDHLWSEGKQYAGLNYIISWGTMDTPSRKKCYIRKFLLHVPLHFLQV